MGKRRHKTKAELRRERARRLGAKQSAVLVKATADHLEFPKPEADLIGEQEHFLRRIERLPDEVQSLAVRLYYSYELRRFVARAALGIAPFQNPPDDLAARRVVVALEPGSTPSRLILDGRGKVVTCLAADMAVGSGTRLPYEEFVSCSEEFEAYQRAHARARSVADSTDLFHYSVELSAAGWLAPRERLESLAELGPAGGLFVATLLKNALRSAGNAFAQAHLPGLRNDVALRRWFRHAGEAAAYLATLADWLYEPDMNFVAGFLGFDEPIVSMVLGACLATWRPFEGDEVVVGACGDEPRIAVSPACALITYHGVLRRLNAEAGAPDVASTLIDEYLDNVRDTYEADLQERRRLGMPLGSLATFCRDLLLLARGGRPDWGDDLVDDPDTLPPLRLDDLCLPGGETSPRALRFLAQRLFANAAGWMRDIFLPAAVLEQWRERLGPLDVVRTGEFSPPWTPLQKPPPVPLNLPGRNEPCPCGSGKKFKKCCLPKVEAGEDVG